MSSFISLLDFNAEDLLEILDRADELYQAWHEDRMPSSLRGQRIALWFYGSGFRNRVAFELGAKAMGADIAYIPGELGVQEPLEDISAYLANWFSLLVIRAKRHADLLQVAFESSIPVVNARTERGHPCEIMGDLQYIRRQRGTLDGLKVVFVGEATNLCLSWLEAAAVLPIRVTQVCPVGYEVEGAVADDLQFDAAGEIKITNDLQGALQDVDLIYTDCWPRPYLDLPQEQIETDFLPYQIQPRHLEALGERGFFLPCPPVTRGQEVSPEAMRSPLCQNHAAKEYLLHTQNAVMEMLAG